MAGTVAGGLKAAKTNIERHGQDFYKNLGAMGGRKGRGPNYRGGFAANPELARIAGRKGGKNSKPNHRTEYLALDKHSEEIISMYKEGIPMTKIAEKLDINYYTIRRWVEKNKEELL